MTNVISVILIFLPLLSAPDQSRGVSSSIGDGAIIALQYRTLVGTIKFDTITASLNCPD